jgi:hypothetical protein
MVCASGLRFAPRPAAGETAHSVGCAGDRHQLKVRINVGQVPGSREQADPPQFRLCPCLGLTDASPSSRSRSTSTAARLSSFCARSTAAEMSADTVRDRLDATARLIAATCSVMFSELEAAAAGSHLLLLE